MKKKVAIVYDWMDSWGGVERLLLVLHDMFPDAPFYTSFIDKDRARWAEHLEVKSSFMQSLPGFLKKSRLMSMSFFSYAFESFDFSEYETVISVTSSFAKGIITRPSTQHICYLLTPTRFLWTHYDQYVTSPVVQSVSAPIAARMRAWDVVAAQRPDKMVALSNVVAERCQKIYRRTAQVIHPPFDVAYWSRIKKKIRGGKHRATIHRMPENYHLLVSRLEPYKNIELAISTFNENKKTPLVIVGSGRREDALKSKASNNIVFLSGLSDESLGKLYTKAQALIMPQEEDFGYVALEAQFFGCPVIAYSKGGALDTVQHKKNGYFFNDQTVRSLQRALEKYHTISYNIQNITKKTGETFVRKFSKELFQKKFESLLR